MMKSYNSGKGGYVSLLFVILLFFSLALCTLFTVLIGAKGYENINGRMEENFQSQTALAYVSNKVKQADAIGGIDVADVEGTSVLVLNQEYGGVPYETMVYYMDGHMMELFCEKNSGMGLIDGTEIMESEEIYFEEEGENLISVNLRGENPHTLYLCMRSGGDADE